MFFSWWKVNQCTAKWQGEGFTLLKYMERNGVNQFVLVKQSDRLKTLHTDILLKVAPPIPVSSRLWGLPKDVVKKVLKLFRVLRSIIFHLRKCILQGLFSRIMIFDWGGGRHLRALEDNLSVLKDREPIPKPIPPFLKDFAMFYEAQNSHWEQAKNQQERSIKILMKWCNRARYRLSVFQYSKVDEYVGNYVKQLGIMLNNRPLRTQKVKWKKPKNNYCILPNFAHFFEF